MIPGERLQQTAVRLSKADLAWLKTQLTVTEPNVSAVIRKLVREARRER